MMMRRLSAWREIAQAVSRCLDAASLHVFALVRTRLEMRRAMPPRPNRDVFRHARQKETTSETAESVARRHFHGVTLSSNPSPVAAQKKGAHIVDACSPRFLSFLRVAAALAGGEI